MSEEIRTKGLTQPGCTIIGTVVAKPERREELRRILEAMVKPTRGEAGCIEYHFHCDKNDDCVFVFYENFQSKEALEIHLAMPYLEPLAARADELLARPVEIRHLEMLSEYARR